MTPLAIDHLVVAARTLEEGAEYIATTTGAAVQGGGRHESMGTHNMLMRLGEACYLEVIAVDPDLPAPKGPRFFGIDRPEMIDRLEKGPCLITWAVRTTDIDGLATRAALGDIRQMSRGTLRWRLTVNADGRLPENGVLPFLIQWETSPHPAATMPESGCTLLTLDALHPEPERLNADLDALGSAGLVTVRPSSGPTPSLAARLTTPRGRVTIT